MIDRKAAEVIGSVGVSGDTSDKDEYCAIAGVQAAGYEFDTSEPASDWAKSRL